MYLPPHFAEPNIEELHRIVRDHPLGLLVRQGPAGLEADHLPFLFSQGAATNERFLYLPALGR